jgi:dehydrodolichyl diphosphate syntase complex subunit NUS1
MESASSTPTSESHSSSTQHISVLLLSAEDGRDSLVDLTKTLAEMSQKSKLSPKDISVDLIDAEISESVMGEPELLVLFGPTVELSGYPPWQVRLTEIYHVQDNQGVGYQVFLRALYNYANAQMRFGR